MNNGFSLQDAINLIDADNENMVFRAIRARLNRGEQLPQFFADYLPNSYAVYFEGFIRFLPFLESLTLTQRITEGERSRQKALTKGLFYPLFLLSGVMLGIMFFNIWVLPSMIDMMNGFGLDGSNYLVMAKAIDIASRVLIAIAVISLAIAAYCMMPGHITSTYRLLTKILPDNLLTCRASSDFAVFFLECVKLNVSTRESLQLLSRLKGKPLVAFIAGQLDSSLDKGVSMEKAMDSPYVEKMLTGLFRIAVYASNCQKMLEGYLEIVSRRTEDRIKKFTVIVQLCAYTAIGAVMIFVYQILMIPMTMIQNF